MINTENDESTAPKDAYELYTICCADQSRSVQTHTLGQLFQLRRRTRVGVEDT